MKSQHRSSSRKETKTERHQDLQFAAKLQHLPLRPAKTGRSRQMHDAREAAAWSKMRRSGAPKSMRYE